MPLPLEDFVKSSINRSADEIKGYLISAFSALAEKPHVYFGILKPVELVHEEGARKVKTSPVLTERFGTIFTRNGITLRSTNKFGQLPYTVLLEDGIYVFESLPLRLPFSGERKEFIEYSNSSTYYPDWETKKEDNTQYVVHGIRALRMMGKIEENIKQGIPNILSGTDNMQDSAPSLM